MDQITLILDRCQHAQEREFFLRATARFGWTRRVLDHQKSFSLNTKAR